MPYYVYIILCDNGSFYTGYTKNVDERLKLHANGRSAKYTKMHKPKKIAYTESYEQRAEAMRREKIIKKLNHKQKQVLIKSQKTKKQSFDKIIRPTQATENWEKTAPKKITWTEKLQDSKDLPKVEPISEKMSKRWGKGTIVIPAPIEVDALMKKVPKGKLTTINNIRETLAKKHNATIGCPMTTGIFAWIAANAAEEQRQNGKTDITPYWRTLRSDGVLNEKYPGGSENQKLLLENEGHTVVSKGKIILVANYEKALANLDRSDH